MTTSATNYTYDDLSRLLTASTTDAVSGGNYSYAYTYDAIGNIASSTESGAYTYAGTNYANPHAATTIGSTTYAYDNNGNLTSKGVWTYAWDYQNRMTSAGNGTATSTYAYDHTGQRVSQAIGGTVSACLTCMKVRGKERSNVCDISSMPNMLKLVESADKVLVF